MLPRSDLDMESSIATVAPAARSRELERTFYRSFPLSWAPLTVCRMSVEVDTALCQPLRS